MRERSKDMRYRVDFDRPGVPNRNAIVPTEISRAAVDEPLGVFVKPAGDHVFAVVDGDDEPAAGRAALKLCEGEGLHFYPNKPR